MNKQNNTEAKTASLEDEKLDLTLRPSRLSEFVGQSSIKDNLKITLEAARKRQEPAEHILLYGPPGLGKTTLAHIIAREMGVSIRVTSGPAIERAGDLASILTNLQNSDVLFIDEIHRLSKIVEEVLYPAMEDFCLDIVMGKGPSARTLRLDLPKFTIIGATTRVGLLSSPLRDRFGVTHRLDYYQSCDLEKIVLRSAKILKIEIDRISTGELARRSRGTPRIANRLLKRVRDYAQVKHDGKITAEVANPALSALAIDKYGLDMVDRLLLDALINKFSGTPVGLDTLAAALSEDAGTIEEVIEPFLLQQGLIKRTPRGRVPTPNAYSILGLASPQTLVQKTFL